MQKRGIQKYVDLVLFLEKLCIFFLNTNRPLAEDESTFNRFSVGVFVLRQFDKQFPSYSRHWTTRYIIRFII